MSIARQLLHEFRPLFRMLDQPLSPAFRSRSLWETNPFLHFDMQAMRPAVDVTEEANRYILQADLPGVKKENIEVRVGDGGRSITIESKFRQQQLQEQSQQPTEEQSADSSNIAESGNQLFVERPFVGNSTFTRTLFLARPVDSNGVTAKLNDGVLTISVPKAEDRENVVVNIE